MIVVPEKVVFIKVPKAASTTIAQLFWGRHGVDQLATVNPEVATALRHLIQLDDLKSNLPMLNGNWFFNRSPLFGWHSSYQDLNYIFGRQISGYHWVASVRHPVTRMFSVYSFQAAKGFLKEPFNAAGFEKFCEKVFTKSRDLTLQEAIHTWPQSDWLPPVGAGPEVSIIRQERFAEDITRLAPQVPAFRTREFAKMNQSFTGTLEEYVKPTVAARIEDFYAVDMERLQYSSLVGQERRVS